MFLIEKIQPDWLKNKLERNFYAIDSMLLGGLIGKLFVMLVDIPVVLILFKISEYFLPEFSYFSFKHFLNFLVRTGLIEALIVSLFIGVSRGEIKPLETLNWSWEKAKKYFSQVLHGLSWLFPGLIGGFIGWQKSPTLGIFLGLVVLITVGLSHWDVRASQEAGWSWKLFREEIVSVVPGLIGGLIFWWIIGDIGLFLGSGIGIIIWFINSGLTYSELVVKTYPNQGIWKSIKNSLLATMIVYIFSFISYELVLAGFYPFSNAHRTQELGLFLFYGISNALKLGMIVAIIAGLTNGGITWIRHFALRVTLYRNGYSPWNYARFLDYCTDRLFLQKVGGGYIFVHRMLLEHFAAMPLEPGRR